MASREEAELKQQGAIEAAQEPNFFVSPEDAENKVVEEAKKAGGAALAFDPDASPEEKAAQARSVSTMVLVQPRTNTMLGAWLPSAPPRTLHARA